MTALLPYENQIFLDLYDNDGLLIMAEGLGIERIFLNFVKLYCDPSHLIMIINTNDAEEKYFINKLKCDYNITYLPQRITTETHTVNERAQAYKKGGTFFITSRILVVDMLTERVPIDLINGILVYKAHRIIDSCQETFIMRMFRQKNKTGFIKAFSDDPIYFIRHKVDRIMKNLFVKKLFIFPRFHVDIETALDKSKPEVIEMHVQLSTYSHAIQMALLDIINILLQELKGCCKYIDHDFLTMENVISKPFDHIIKAQLEPVWNQVGTKPKQLVSDMKTLRLLLHYLTQYDCVTFYKMLTCLKSHEKELGRSSGWLFLDAANELFTNARLRVYGTNMANSKILIKNDKQKLIFNKENKELAARIIEESPKLKALKEVLSEISFHSEEESGDEGINVLITANDDRTCLQIKQFLNNNEMITQISKSVSSSKDLDQVDLLKGNEEDETNDEEFVEKLLLKNNIIIEESNEVKPKKTAKRKKKPDEVTLTQMLKNKKTNEDSSGDDDESSKDSTTKTNTKKRINVYLSALEGSSKQKISLLRLLYEVKPKYVCLYDIELRFVRQLEIYKMYNYELSMRVYFLMYTNSCEEQRYLTAIRSEKEAFEVLIKEKASMVIQEEQDGKTDLNKIKDLLSEEQTIEMKLNSRKGGVALVDETKSKVIVDMREFRSELPSLLHKRDIHVEPVTLEVGDYILTPDMCVERKSLNDLIESLANGRLYNQATSMCRYYKTPILLIEFDQNKPFHLTNNIPVTNEISPQQVSSKLVLLTIHFPKLRILWCSSPHETAELFEELKSGYAQPNSETAMSIRTDQIASDMECKYNPILQDILIKIPGVNAKNCQRIMSKVKNLNEFFQMSEEQMTEIFENSKTAKCVFEFVNKKLRNVDDDEKMEEYEVEQKKSIFKKTSKTSKTK